MIRVENVTQLPVPAARVWQALTAFDRYRLWHPSIRLGGEPALGAQLELHFTRKLVAARTRKTWARVVEFEPMRAFAWRLGALAFVRVTEGYRVAESGSGAILRHWLEYRGLFALFAGEPMRQREAAMIRKADAALRAHLLIQDGVRARRHSGAPQRKRRRPR